MATEGEKLVHFRGRELHGKLIPVPTTHYGAVLRSPNALPSTGAFVKQEVLSGGDNNNPKEQILDAMGEFQDFVLWSHSPLSPDQSSSAYSRAMEELLQISYKVRMPRRQGESM